MDKNLIIESHLGIELGKEFGGSSNADVRESAAQERAVTEAEGTDHTATPGSDLPKQPIRVAVELVPLELATEQEKDGGTVEIASLKLGFGHYEVRCRCEFQEVRQLKDMLDVWVTGHPLTLQVEWQA